MIIDDRGLCHLYTPHLVTAAACSGSGAVDWHVHDLVEIVVVDEGEIAIDVDGTIVRGRHGATLILPAARPHRQHPVSKWRTLCLLFHPAPETAWADQPRIIVPDPTNAVLEWAEQLCTFFIAPEPSDRLLDGLLLAVLERLATLDQATRSQSSVHPVIAAALDELVAHLDEPVNMRQLARRLGISYVHFSRLFREQLGASPLRYHRNLRLDRAGQLLLNPYVQVGAVGMQCGFDDANYFNRRFRQRFGVSPGRWKQQRLAAHAAADRKPPATPSRADAGAFLDATASIDLRRLPMHDH